MEMENTYIRHILNMVCYGSYVFVHMQCL